MAEAVTVTRFRAKDGSLHDTEASAKWHDRWRTEDQIKTDIDAAISHRAWTGFYFLKLDEDERDRFTREIAELIFDKRTQIAPHLERARALLGPSS